MATDSADTEQAFGLLLKGGHVIDPANDIDGSMDIAIKGQRIAQVSRDIPPTSAQSVVDVSGHYVTPGILDIHMHVYVIPSSTDFYVMTLNADAHSFASGVTTVVDTGTAGHRHFQDFRERCIDRSKTRILAFVNIAGGGMVNKTSEQDVQDFDPEQTAMAVEENADVIVGIKTAHYWTSQPWDSEHQPWTSVEAAVAAGNLCGKPVMVDFWPRLPERPYPDLLLMKLRPGDIHTHVFAQQFPVLDEQNRVHEYMFQARERGVRFDLGHGAASFWFRNAVPAIRDGFPPDTISTDLHMSSINGAAGSMANTMSKCLNMGMSLQEVIARSTMIPAQVIGRPELGTLSVGAEADVAVFRHLEGRFGFTDCGDAKMIGHEKLECAMTIRAGEKVYDPTGLSVPLWEDAPAPYWHNPTLQS